MLYTFSHVNESYQRKIKIDVRIFKEMVKVC